MNEAFAQFYEKLCLESYEEISNYCHAIMRDYPYDAEDCVQNTFLSALENIIPLYSHPNPLAWLYTTAKNRVRASIKVIFRRKKME
ncbi:hypothetical protein FACS1894202_07420 [Clostridia bacterium]|nr:hypothetical protein FACS1894202_07420 [Clostridia bacterium]